MCVLRRLTGEFLHNCIAHPLLFMTRNHRWADRFHDWTAKIAWPI
jgi:hypothetical protein